MVKYFKGRDPLMKDLERDVNVESDCEPGEPVVPVITPPKINPPQKTSPIQASRKPEAKGPQPPQPQTPTKSIRNWDKMALEITDPRPPQHAPPPVVEPVFASWGRSGSVSPTLDRRTSHPPLVSISKFRYRIVYRSYHSP